MRIWPIVTIAGALVGCAESQLSNMEGSREESDDAGEDLDPSDSGAPEESDDEAAEAPARWWAPTGTLTIAEDGAVTLSEVELTLYAEDGDLCTVALDGAVLSAGGVPLDPVFAWWSVTVSWPLDAACALPNGFPSDTEGPRFELGLGRSDTRLAAAADAAGFEADPNLETQYGLYAQWAGVETPWIFGLATPVTEGDEEVRVVTAAPIPAGAYELVPLLTLPLDP